MDIRNPLHLRGLWPAAAEIEVPDSFNPASCVDWLASVRVPVTVGLMATALDLVIEPLDELVGLPGPWQEESQLPAPIEIYHQARSILMKRRGSPASVVQEKVIQPSNGYLEPPRFWHALHKEVWESAMWALCWAARVMILGQAKDHSAFEFAVEQALRALNWHWSPQESGIRASSIPLRWVWWLDARLRQRLAFVGNPN